MEKSVSRLSLSVLLFFPGLNNPEAFKVNNGEATSLLAQTVFLVAWERGRKKAVNQVAHSTKPGLITSLARSKFRTRDLQKCDLITIVCPVPRRGSPPNSTCRCNAGLMLGHRLRQWPNIKPTLGHVSCHAGGWLSERCWIVHPQNDRGPQHN